MQFNFSFSYFCDKGEREREREGGIERERKVMFVCNNAIHAVVSEMQRIQLKFHLVELPRWAVDRGDGGFVYGLTE